MASIQSSNTSAPRARRISDLQKQNIKTLMADIKNSIDVPPSETSLSDLKATVKAAFSDRTITKSELKAITVDVVDVIESAGITAAEARVIFYDLQDIAETSRLPRTNDNLQGTEGDDILWSGLGNDTLQGAAAEGGVDDVDWLCGGGGKDTFVLGNSTTAFYNDGNAATVGLSDYAAILDFNKTKDVIQLHGSASDYQLSALPQELGIAGTGIYYKTGNAVVELIGVVVGVNVTDFATGFTFV